MSIAIMLFKRPTIKITEIHEIDGRSKCIELYDEETVEVFDEMNVVSKCTNAINDFISDTGNKTFIETHVTTFQNRAKDIRVYVDIYKYNDKQMIKLFTINPILSLHSELCDNDISSVELKIVREIAFQKSAYKLNNKCGFESPSVDNFGKFLSRKNKQCFYILMPIMNGVTLTRDANTTEFKKKITHINASLIEYKNIHHNDLTYRNILIGPNCEIQVIDFGEADNAGDNDTGSLALLLSSDIR